MYLARGRLVGLPWSSSVSQTKFKGASGVFLHQIYKLGCHYWYITLTVSVTLYTSIKPMGVRNCRTPPSTWGSFMMTQFS